MNYDYNKFFICNFRKWPFADFSIRRPAPVLEEGCKILENIGVDYFLICGVALGFHRSDDFIPYDSDIDIGIRLDASKPSECIRVKNAVWDAFMKEYYNPLRVTFYGDEQEFPMQMVFTNERRVPFDMFFFYDNIEPDFVTHYSDQGIIRCKKEHIDNIKKVKYKHGTYPIPTPTDEFLEFYYGPNWKVPSGKKKLEWADEANTGKSFEIKNTPWRTGNEDLYREYTRKKIEQTLLDKEGASFGKFAKWQKERKDATKRSNT